MLGLADRGRVLDLFDMVMSGDAAGALALGHAAGAAELGVGRPSRKGDLEEPRLGRGEGAEGDAHAELAAEGPEAVAVGEGDGEGPRRLHGLRAPGVGQRAAHRVVVLELSGDAGFTYVIERTSDFTSWYSVSTNTLSSGSAQITNSVSPGTSYELWRAVWYP